MCLGVPLKIIKVEGNQALGELAGVARSIDISLLPDVKLGDYVLVHAGFAITKIDETEAQKTLQVLEDEVWKK